MKNKQSFFFCNKKFHRCVTTINFLKDGELYLHDGKIEDKDSDFNVCKILLPSLIAICPPNFILYVHVEKEGDNQYAIVVPKPYAMYAFDTCIVELSQRGYQTVVADLLAAVLLPTPEVMRQPSALPPQAAPAIPEASIAPPPAPPRVNEDASSEHDRRYCQSPSEQVLANIEAFFNGGNTPSPGSQHLYEEESSHQSRKRARL